MMGFTPHQFFIRERILRSLTVCIDIFFETSLNILDFIVKSLLEKATSKCHFVIATHKLNRKRQ